MSQSLSNFYRTNYTYKSIDLFAGLGGIRMGFEKVGFKTVFANDFDKNSKIAYDLNFGDSSLTLQDLKTIEPEKLPDFDFLFGGFPCQAFSIAGYRKGFEDSSGRGDLFFYIAKILETKEPQGFMLENVKNLVTHDNGKTFQIILNTLHELGYYVKYQVLNTMEYGNLRQNRERIYIVGFKDPATLNRFQFPKKQFLTQKMDDILDKEIDAKYYYNDKPLYPSLKDGVLSFETFYQWRRQYVRENKKNVCPTLTANMGTGGHNVPIVRDLKGIRKLTPRECFRLQGFPDSYKLPFMSDSGLYKLIGNSVSVNVIEQIAKQVHLALEPVSIEEFKKDRNLQAIFNLRLVQQELVC